MKKVIFEKYLKYYAEKEINLVPAINQSFDEVIVIPAHNEYDELLEVLNTSLPRISREKNLILILVVNGSEDSNQVVHDTNLKLLKYFEEKSSINLENVINYIPYLNYHIIIVNRATETKVFDKKSGVGLARKIGCDIALNLHYNFNLKSNWIRTTDADVVLPIDYLDINPDKNKYSAIIYPFYHQCNFDDNSGKALQLYEIYLRYYYLGLAWSGSPYAFHTVGSSMAVSVDSYNNVRGFPAKREAAEDFYMLNKLTKVLPVYRTNQATIRIKGRPSDRVPFGTGASMAKIAIKLDLNEEYNIYNPQIFDYLKDLYKLIALFCENRNISEIINSKNQILISNLKTLGFEEALTNSLTQTNDKSMLKRHLHTWFDGFKTLKLINQLSINTLNPVRWDNAINNCQFITFNDGFSSKIEEIRQELYFQELNLTEKYNQSLRMT